MKFPVHLSIIPDGNRTRALGRWLTVFDGYIKSVEKAVEMAKYIFTTTPVKVISGWGMSTENRKKRPEAELEFLFNMYKTSGDMLNDFMLEHKINFRWIGDESTLPQHFLEYMNTMEKTFTFDTDRTIIFAVNYGWRNEIIRWVKAYEEAWNSIDDLTEDNLGEYMDLGDFPPVDLVIRTKGEMSSRVSGFMSRWIGYAELYFEPKLFQDVEMSDLDKALTRYDSVAGFRNFGG